jgi:predicted transcriptional regulator
MNYINGQVESENWDSLTDIQKAGIESGIYQLDHGTSISHEIVMEELKKKYGIK